MKTILAFVLLAAIWAASSHCQAADTLVITSHNVVDRCSGDSTWIISGSIGEVYFADSLMSFDIALRYDTTKLRPIQGLSTGTISAQLNALGGPTFSFRTPSEMRVSAFSINTPAKGNLPLFAFTGLYIGSCNTHDSLTAPMFAVEINPESRRQIVAIRSEYVQAVANRTDRPQFGVSINADTVRLPGELDGTAIACILKTEEGKGGRMKVHVALADKAILRIDSILIENEETRSVVAIREPDSSWTLDFAVGNSDSVSMTVWVERSSGNIQGNVTMTAYTEYQAECACYNPMLRDSAVIKVDSVPTTGIEMETGSDERPAMLQDIHGKAGNLTVMNILGQELHKASVLDGWEIREELLGLGSGVYILNFQGQTGNPVTVFLMQ